MLRCCIYLSRLEEISDLDLGSIELCGQHCHGLRLALEQALRLLCLSLGLCPGPTLLASQLQLLLQPGLGLDPTKAD